MGCTVVEREEGEEEGGEEGGVYSIGERHGVIAGWIEQRSPAQ